jgi:FkbM family methyltransferase
LQENDYFVDCGANVGEVSMAVSLRSQCKILVVEPESLEFECLKLNLPLNRTIFYHGVLSDVDGYVDFYSVPNSADSSIIQPQPNLRPSTSKSWRLELKLEAEGAEPEVLFGSTQIMDRIAYVAFDASPERGISQASTQEEVIQILGKQRFEIKKFIPERFILFIKATT